MGEATFRIFSVIGIIATLVVSIIGMLKTNKLSKNSTYNNVITTQRLQKEAKLREAVISYATQITRLCSVTNDDYLDAYKELTKAHYSIILSMRDANTSLHDDMSHIRALALNIVQATYIIKNNNITDEKTKEAGMFYYTRTWNENIKKLKQVYDGKKVLYEITKMLQNAWDISRQEAFGIIAKESDSIPTSSINAQSFYS